MNTEFTEAFLSDCTESLVNANLDFHNTDYKDECYCKKNLQWVMAQIKAESTKEARHTVAKHYAEIIRGNNATAPRGCPHNHVWCLTRTEPLLPK
jgi:hypothetical protein